MDLLFHILKNEFLDGIWAMFYFSKGIGGGGLL